MKLQNMRVTIFALAIFYCISPLMSMAQDTTSVTLPEMSTESDIPTESDTTFFSVSSALQMIFALGCIVGLAYLILHKGLGAIISRQRNGDIIKIKERVPLDGKHSLILVEVNGQQLLLSTSERGVRLILPMLPPEKATSDTKLSFASIQKHLKDEARPVC